MCATLHSSLQDLCEKCNEYSKYLKSIENKMSELKQAGMTNANLHYRENTYLCLIYPQINGQRDRKYIGNDPTKIKKYIRKSDRYKQYYLLSCEKKRIISVIKNSVKNLNEKMHTHKVKI